MWDLYVGIRGSRSCFVSRLDVFYKHSDLTPPAFCPSDCRDSVHGAESWLRLMQAAGWKGNNTASSFSFFSLSLSLSLCVFSVWAPCAALTAQSLQVKQTARREMTQISSLWKRKSAHEKNHCCVANCHCFTEQLHPSICHISTRGNPIVQASYCIHQTTL